MKKTFVHMLDETFTHLSLASILLAGVFILYGSALPPLWRSYLILVPLSVLGLARVVLR